MRGVGGFYHGYDNRRHCLCQHLFDAGGGRILAAFEGAGPAGAVIGDCGVRKKNGAPGGAVLMGGVGGSLTAIVTGAAALVNTLLTLAASRK